MVETTVPEIGPVLERKVEDMAAIIIFEESQITLTLCRLVVEGLLVEGLYRNIPDRDRVVIATGESTEAIRAVDNFGSSSIIIVGQGKDPADAMMNQPRASDVVVSHLLETGFPMSRVVLLSGTDLGPAFRDALHAGARFLYKVSGYHTDLADVLTTLAKQPHPPPPTF